MNDRSTYLNFAGKLGCWNMYRYPGGIFAWKGAKYPTEGEEK